MLLRGQEARQVLPGRRCRTASMLRRAPNPRRCAPRPVRMNRAGRPVTVHAHPARDRYPYCRRVLPDPQGHRARQETCHARCVPGSPAPTWHVMTTLVPRFPNTPALSWRLRRRPPYPAAATPTPPSGTAIRSSRRSLPSIQRTPRSPAAVLIYQYPDAERADGPALLRRRRTSAAGKPDRPSAHTPSPVRPRLLTEPATKPGSAPGPHAECLRRQTLPLVAPTVRAPQSVKQRRWVMRTPPRPRDLLPSRAGARRNGPHYARATGSTSHNEFIMQR